ncbi:MAG: hypothetical protein NZ828_00930 [Alphaproteobacteria bacterium]|nr:hypothetical protein [Alphaproteobacteria bacterium]
MQTREFLSDIDLAMAKSTHSSARTAREKVKALFEQANNEVRSTEEDTKTFYIASHTNNAALMKVLLNDSNVQTYLENAEDIDVNLLTDAINKKYEDSFHHTANYSSGAGFLSSHFTDRSELFFETYQKASRDEELSYSSVKLFKQLLESEAIGAHRHSDAFFNAGVHNHLAR